MPGDALSSAATPQASMLSPDNLVFRGALPDYESGGVGLDDGSEGLLVQDWTCDIDGNNIVVEDSHGHRTTVLTRPGVTEASLAFDNNMRATLAYVQDGVVKLWWFDSVPGQMVDSSFPGAHSPRLSTDDKRPMHQSDNDVIFAYLRDGALYYRQQRDRYLVERQLYAGIDPLFRLRNVGMNRALRLQFELGR